MSFGEAVASVGEAVASVAAACSPIVIGSGAGTTGTQFESWLSQAFCAASTVLRVSGLAPARIRLNIPAMLRSQLASTGSAQMAFSTAVVAFAQSKLGFGTGAGSVWAGHPEDDAQSSVRAAAGIETNHNSPSAKANIDRAIIMVISSADRFSG